jgi:hypothetical protein
MAYLTDSNIGTVNVRVLPEFITADAISVSNAPYPGADPVGFLYIGRAQLSFHEDVLNSIDALRAGLDLLRGYYVAAIAESPTRDTPLGIEDDVAGEAVS